MAAGENIKSAASEDSAEEKLRTCSAGSMESIFGEHPFSSQESSLLRCAEAYDKNKSFFILFLGSFDHTPTVILRREW